MTTIELTDEQAALIVGPDEVQVVPPKMDDEELVSVSSLIVSALGMLLTDDEWLTDLLSVFVELESENRNNG